MNVVRFTTNARESMFESKLDKVNLRAFLQSRFDVCAGLDAVRVQVVLMAGVASNAAWLMCLDALDQVRKHPNYRQKVKKVFKDVLRLQRQRELELQHGRRYQYFFIGNLGEEGRALLSNGTSKDYYDYWTSFGSKLYYDTNKGVIADLRKRYKTVLDNHGLEHADILQYVLCASKCLALANACYKSVMIAAESNYHIKESDFDRNFKMFEMQDIHRRWVEGMFRLEPKLMYLPYTEKELDILEEGAGNLSQAWTDPVNIFGSVIDATLDYGDTFPNLAKTVDYYEKVEEEAIKNL